MGGFDFTEEETFIDEKEQKVLYRWRLNGPHPKKAVKGSVKNDRGLDILHFQDGKIIKN